MTDLIEFETKVLRACAGDTGVDLGSGHTAPLAAIEALKGRGLVSRVDGRHVVTERGYARLAELGAGPG